MKFYGYFLQAFLMKGQLILFMPSFSTVSFLIFSFHQLPSLFLYIPPLFSLPIFSLWTFLIIFLFPSVSFLLSFPLRLFLLPTILFSWVFFLSSFLSFFFSSVSLLTSLLISFPPALLFYVLFFIFSLDTDASSHPFNFITPNDCQKNASGTNNCDNARNSITYVGERRRCLGWKVIEERIK